MKSEILGLGKDSLVYGIGSVITRSVGLITLPLFTAYLDPTEYGVLAMLGLLTMIAQPIFSLGLSAAMGPSYFQEDSSENKSQAVWSVFCITLVSSAMLIVLAWVFPEIFGRIVGIPSEHVYLVSISLTGTALTILVTSFTQRVQFERQARLYVTITVATALMAIMISVYTVVFLNWGIRGMVYGQIAGNAVTFIAFTTVGLKHTVTRVNRKTIQELLWIGVPLVPSYAFLFIMMHSNRFFLEWYHGLGAVGIYYIGFNLGLALKIVTGGVQTAWYPFFMRYVDKKDEARIIFGRIFSYYTIGVGLLTLYFYIFAKPVLLVLVDPAYSGAYRVIGLVATASYFTGMYSLLLPGLYYEKEISIQSVLQGCAALISLPIAFALTWYYSILGAAISVTLSHVLLSLITYMWNRHRQKRYVVVEYEKTRVLRFIAFFGVIALVTLVVEIEGVLANWIFSFAVSMVATLVAIQFAKKEELLQIPLLRLLKI